MSATIHTISAGPLFPPGAYFVEGDPYVHFPPQPTPAQKCLRYLEYVLSSVSNYGGDPWILPVLLRDGLRDEGRELHAILSLSGHLETAADFDRHMVDVLAASKNYAGTRDVEDFDGVPKAWAQLLNCVQRLRDWVAGKESLAATLTISAPSLAAASPPAASSSMVDYDPKTQSFKCGGDTKSFGKTLPFKILLVLAAHPGHLCSLSLIKQNAWPANSLVTSHALQQHVSELRKALKATGGVWADLAARIKCSGREYVLDVSAANDQF